MNVLILTTTFPRWIDDPVPSFIYDLSLRLAKRGLNVVVLAPFHHRSKKFETFQSVKVYRYQYFWPSRYQRLAYDGGILSNLKRGFLERIQLLTLFFSQMYHTLKIVNKEKIDLIYSHWILPNGLVGAMCSRLLRKKHIFTEHAGGVAALRKIPFRRYILRFIISNTVKATAVSGYIKDRLLSLIDDEEFRKEFEKKVVVLPMGVDTKKFYPLKNVEQLKSEYGFTTSKLILFIGRIVEKKGLQYMIRAMPKILEKEKDLKLLICGDGPLRNTMEKLSNELGVSNNIIFRGYITEKEKIDLMHLSDLLVVPSIVTDTGDTEGLPVVIIEGLASGLPIVASNTGGINDIIVDNFNGRLVPQKDIETLAETVIELLSNEEERKRLSRNALASSALFDWTRIGEEYTKLILALA
jgi:glycosyltransferase involved in cell wall biosynthesis